jgi:hypothetical protein
MTLLHTAVALFSDIANFFGNSQLQLLLQCCPIYYIRIQVIIAYLETTDIIVDSIDTVGNPVSLPL